MAEFIHLHLHTEYSLLDGACRVGELLDEASRRQIPALAVTEHGNMFSSVIFHDKARQKGIKPILGCEIYVAPGSRLVKSGAIGESNNHLVLLAENAEGYRNLIKLVSAAYTEGFYYRPRIDKELLAQHARGLIALSSCLKGEIPVHLRHNQEERAIEAAAAYRDILGPGNFYLELQYQGIEEQRGVNAGLQRVAKSLDLPLVCTNDVHYLNREDFKAHDILLCIGTGKTVQEPERMRYHGDQFYLKSPAEMEQLFGDVPGAMANTVRIAERCNVDLGKTVNHLPDFEVPAGQSLDEYFERMVWEGFDRRRARLDALEAAGELRHTLAEYRARVTYEISIITRMKYAGYFLIVWDFIRYARDHGIPVGPGRGSAAGSVVAYCLDITDVDPLHFDLIFERFLNPERVSMPDIDIDFCERRRGEVIEYVTRKYGRENVAQIITFGTMKAKAVVRDVGRALDIPYADVDKVAKQIPPALDMTLDKALAENPALKEMEDTDPRVKELLEVARRLEGLSRHASVHAAGVVIAPRPIIEFAPLHKGARDEITTQWSMKEIERIGLLKMDFLGLSTLTLLDDAVAEIKRTTGAVIDLTALPLDDAKTYELFSEGQTLGVFQFESGGMRDILRKARPQRLEDLIALNALYRPGPLRGGMVDDFINRKHGRVEVKYELPQLEPVLRDTYGVIAYQEQVMRIANEVAGFSLGEADLLRKAMGKKNAEVMQAQRQKFLDGAAARGVDAKKARDLFDLMEKFAGYGFNKSHSTTYALVAYQTAYLKANYPAHFMAALLTIESQNTPKLAMYLGECRDMGVTVLPPDINSSELAFTVTPDGVRFGLGAVKNVGESAVLALLDVRRREGRVRSLYRLCEQLDSRQVNRRVFESLVKAGALDSVANESTALAALPAASVRARLFAAVEKALDSGNRARRDREQGQAQLFGGFDQPVGESVPIETELPDAPPWTEAQQLSGEKESLGLYWSGHPVERYASELKAIGARTIAELLADSEAPDDTADDAPPPVAFRAFETSVGGIIVAVRPLKTRKGARMAAFTLDDPQGSLEVIVFPDAFEKAVALIQTDSMVLVKGQFDREDDKPKLKANEIVPIDAVREKAARSVAVRLVMPPHDRATVEAVLDVLARHKGDRRVCLELELRGTAQPIRVLADVLGHVRVKPSAQLVADLEKVCGQGTVILR
jgi:DNA polymerase III subunit alpha